MNKHIRINHQEKRFSCNVCHTKLGTKQALEEHILSHGEKTIPCDQCESKYASERKLRLHKYRCHQLRAHKCAECAQKFKLASCLRRHISQVFTRSYTTVLYNMAVYNL